MSKHLVILALLVVIVAGYGQGYVERTQQFATQVKRVVNPDELQAWATNLIAKTPSGNRNAGMNPRVAGIPKGFLDFYEDQPTPDVWVSVGDGGACVVICYGSGFGHWGLYVGDKSSKQESTQQFYVVPWQPGIYFWDGP
jgi:hypothetical protein